MQVKVVTVRRHRCLVRAKPKGQTSLFSPPSSLRLRCGPPTRVMRHASVRPPVLRISERLVIACLKSHLDNGRPGHGTSQGDFVKKFWITMTGLGTFFMALLVSSSLSVPAHAATSVYSIWGTYGPYLGIAYANLAVTQTNPGYPIGEVDLKTTNGTTIPAGWSGTEGTVYLNGAVCGTSSTSYYPNPTQGYGAVTVMKNCGHGNYTSRGITSAYTGNGYARYYTYTSPVLQY